MQLPSKIEDLFTQNFNGFRAVKLRTATEAVAVENALGRASLSFQTKITRSKKHGREFVISLVQGEPALVPAPETAIKGATAPAI